MRAAALHHASSRSEQPICAACRGGGWGARNADLGPVDHQVRRSHWRPSLKQPSRTQHRPVAADAPQGPGTRGRERKGLVQKLCSAAGQRSRSRRAQRPRSRQQAGRGRWPAGSSGARAASARRLPAIDQRAPNSSTLSPSLRHWGHQPPVAAVPIAALVTFSGPCLARYARPAD